MVRHCAAGYVSFSSGSSLHRVLPAHGIVRSFLEETIMAWKTPKIAEVQVGMEINMYACAKQK
jgi:coenzyme PQQ precursor peptide PqqA